MLLWELLTLVNEGHRIFEGDDEEELDVELAGVVVSEYLASVLQESSEISIFTFAVFSFVEDDLFSTTTTVT